MHVPPCFSGFVAAEPEPFTIIPLCAEPLLTRCKPQKFGLRDILGHMKLARMVTRRQGEQKHLSAFETPPLSYKRRPRNIVGRTISISTRTKILRQAPSAIPKLPAQNRSKFVQRKRPERYPLGPLYCLTIKRTKFYSSSSSTIASSVALVTQSSSPHLIKVTP